MDNRQEKRAESWKREARRLDSRLRQAVDLLEEAESNVWVECACEPKKPGWWSGDQWEFRPYKVRAEERTQRCTFHAQYDAFLNGTDDSQIQSDYGIPK